jgi:hypothetical protein
MKVLDVLQYVEQNKHRLRSHDRVKISNHLNYALSTMDNMINIRHVEEADPYNETTGNYQLNPRMSNRTVIYNTDGTTKIVDKSKLNVTGDGWEQQFDENLLLNPPCYVMPPQNLTDINNIRKVSLQQRMSR